MSRYCSVCSKNDTFSKDLSFHRFPNNVEECFIWLSALNKEQDFLAQWKQPELCSDHFNPSDILPKRGGGKYLKRGAVPNAIFLESSDSSSSASSSPKRVPLDDSYMDSPPRHESPLLNELSDGNFDDQATALNFAEDINTQLLNELCGSIDNGVGPSKIAEELNRMEKFILEAKEYFTFEEWTNFDESEKLKYGKTLYIYYACIHLGIKIVAPEFLWKPKNVTEGLTIGIKKTVYLCEYCDCTYNLKEHIVKHRKTCRKRFTFEKKQKYSCEDCGYSNDLLKNVKRHKLTHAKKQSYNCQFCDKSFSQLSYVQQHINSSHSTTQKFFKCSKCSYKARLKKNLEIHNNVHLYCKQPDSKFEFKGQSFQSKEREKPYKCLKCGKSFFYKTHLTTHMNAFHMV